MRRRHFHQLLALGGASWLGQAIPAMGQGRLKTIARKGVPYVSLAQVLHRYGFKRSFAGADCILSSRWSRIVLTLDNRIATFNGTKIYLNAPFVKLTASDWGIAEVDVTKTLDPLLLSRSQLRGLGSRLVLIDPGHGGGKTGSRSRDGRVVEKTAAFDVTKRVESRLRAKGFKVMLTRTSDKDVGLFDRAARAGVVKADLLVSIHFNAAGSTTASGIETFAVAPPGQRSTHDNAARGDTKRHHGNAFDAANMVAAHAIQSALLAQTGAVDRGVKRARFVVIREARAPSVLVEGGFLSNVGEARKVATVAYRDKLAHGIAHGIFDYMGKVRAAQT